MSLSGFIMTYVDTATGAAKVSVKYGTAPFCPANHLAVQCPLFGDRADKTLGRVLRCSTPPVLGIIDGGEIYELTPPVPWRIVVEDPRPGIWTTRFVDPEVPDGRLHLALERRLATEMEIAQAGFDLPQAGAELFSDQELDAYREIHQAECRLAETSSKSRVDLRGHSVLTIDNDDTRDIDDAIEIKVIRPERHYILGVHIADVTAFVRLDSPRDKDAFDRSTSHYLADTVLHMLPEFLSADLCSLVPNEDRLALSVYLEILILDGRAQIKGSRIFPSLIRSRRRLSYTEVNQILTEEGRDEDRTTLGHAVILADALLALRPTGNGQENDHGPSGAMIEHFMVAANNHVGRHMAKTIAALPGGGHSALFRNQPGPRVDELLGFAAELSHVGLLDATEEELIAAAREREKREFATVPSQREKGALFQSALHKEIRARVAMEGDLTLFSSMAGRPGRKSLFRAASLTLSPKDSGHHELGLSRYAWFTSPIRRYPDIVNHRFLKGRDAQNLSLDDVQRINRRLVNGRAAQRLFKERQDFATLVRENLIEAGRSVEIVVLNFRFASPYQLLVKGRIAGVDVTIQIRDAHGATIDAEAFECRFSFRDKPAVAFKPGQTARLHVREGDISQMAGRILANTDQWSS